MNLKFTTFPLTVLVALAEKSPATVPFIVYSVFGLEVVLNLTLFTVNFKVSPTVLILSANFLYVSIPFASAKPIFTVNTFSSILA